MKPHIEFPYVVGVVKTIAFVSEGVAVYLEDLKPELQEFIKHYWHHYAIGNIPSHDLSIQVRDNALEDAAIIAESYVRFANHNPHCLEIAKEIREQKSTFKKEVKPFHRESTKHP